MRAPDQPAANDPKYSDSMKRYAKPLYVYVAGPLSGSPGEYLANVSAMTKYARQLIEEGSCPINPAADLLEGLISGRPMPTAQYQLRSMHLLRLLEGRTDAALHVLAMLHRDGTPSAGVLAEVDEAERLGIPIHHVWRGQP